MNAIKRIVDALDTGTHDPRQISVAHEIHHIMKIASVKHKKTLKTLVREMLTAWAEKHDTEIKELVDGLK